MSFNPAASEISTSTLLIPSGQLPRHVGVAIKLTPELTTKTVKSQNECSTAKLVGRRLPRALKARKRLRRKNRLRATVARTN